MSSQQDVSPFTDVPQETQPPEKLAASRWAPGGAEVNMTGLDMTANKQFSNETTAATKGLASSMWSKVPVAKDNKAVAKAPQGPANSRGSRDLAKYNQVDNKVKLTNKTNNEEKHSNAMPSQSRQFTINHEDAATTETTLKPGRIIGPLSEEEKDVKMENPFFDPTKHKGLGSSRWA